MAVTLRIDNYSSLNALESTVFDADSAAGVSTIIVRNTQGIAANSYILLGIAGAESSELVQVSTVPNSTSFTLAAPTKLNHFRFDPVQQLFGDKIKIYTAPNVDGSQPLDASFTALSGGLITMLYDQASTNFTDAAGDATKWYKFSYINTTTSAETALGDSGAARGGGANNYCTVDNIRDQASLQNNRWVTDAQIANKRAIAQAEIDSELAGLYVVPFTAPINPLIADLTARLAAGLQLSDAYGMNSASTSQDGAQRLVDARAMLMRIKTKELILTNAQGVETASANSNTVQSWPDASTDGTNEANAGGGHMFRISHRY